MMATPIFRFKGFTGDWEQRKFPEFVQFYNGQTYKPEDVQDDGVLVLRSSNVKNDEIVDADNVYLDKSVANAEQVRKSDIIVVVRNGSRALIGKHAEIKREMPNTVIGAFMTGIRSEHSSFVNALLGTPQFEREIEMNMGATINQITGYMFSKMAFMIPSGDEQDKIGAYFKDLDDLIALHQRKCDALKDLKKGMLQKMFPKEGAKVPEFRFKGFTGDWVQRKLGDCCGQLMATVNPQDTPNDYFIEYSMPAFDDGEIPNVVKGCTMNSARKVIDRPCLLINKLNVRKKRIWNVEILGNNAVSSMEFVPVYSDKINLSFLKQEVMDDTFTTYLEDCSSGTSNSQKRVTPDIIMSARFLMPTKEEQDKIALFFDNIDNLITLHQRKCDALKDLKKGMLQKMFV